MVKRVNACKQRCETKQLKSLVCVCVCWCEPYLSGEPPLELLLGLLLLSLVLLCGRRSSRERVCYCQRKSASRIKARPLVPNIPSHQWNSTAATSDFGPTYTSYVVYVRLYFIFMNLRLRMFLCSSSSVVGLWLSRLEGKKRKKILFLLIESVKNRCFFFVFVFVSFIPAESRWWFKHPELQEQNMDFHSNMSEKTRRHFPPSVPPAPLVQRREKNSDFHCGLFIFHREKKNINRP